MSLPIPSTTSANSSSMFNNNMHTNMDPKQLQAMEAPMIALANSAGGDLRKLFYAFFSFLHRRTDFYLVPNDADLKEGKAKMGFPEGEAEKLLLAAFRQFPLRRIPRQQQQPQQAGTAAGATAAKKSATPPTSTAVKKPAPTTTTTSNTSKVQAESTNESKPTTTSTTSSSTAAAATSATTDGTAATTKTDEKKIDDTTIRYTEEGLQVPVGNGGSTKRYKWTQTLDECTVMLGVPEGTRAKDLDVSIKPSSIHVKTKAAAATTKPTTPPPNPSDGESISVTTTTTTTYVEGPLTAKIKPDESTWSLEGGVIIMILSKITKTFWATVIEGDEKIDTSLVDSRRHISDYDEATQGQLRKIMFDQKQQEKGLPTSDEMMGIKTIPPLPPGVEYIDKSTFENDDKNKKKSNK